MKRRSGVPVAQRPLRVAVCSRCNQLDGFREDGDGGVVSGLPVSPRGKKKRTHLRAAICARRASAEGAEQRPKSITRQIAACREYAALKGFVVPGDHVYKAVLDAAKRGEFEVILVDDLARLARDAVFTLTTIEELLFCGVRIVSASDGLDTGNPEYRLAIRMKSIVYEDQLESLRKNTFRGQLGQRMAGFFTGDRPYGYEPKEVGPFRTDKHGRPRPAG